MSETLSPKRGFIERDDWERIGSSKPPAPRIWPEASAMNDDVRVLIIPNPDREPTDAEVEALVAKLYGRLSATCPTAAARTHRRKVARAAWALGARVPS